MGSGVEVGTFSRFICFMLQSFMMYRLFRFVLLVLISNCLANVFAFCGHGSPCLTVSGEIGDLFVYLCIILFIYCQSAFMLICLFNFLHVCCQLCILGVGGVLCVQFAVSLFKFVVVQMLFH